VKDDSNNIERVEKYLAGELEGEDLKKFQNQLETDPELKEAIALEQGLAKGIQEAAQEDLNQQMDLFHEEMEEEMDAMSEEQLEDLNIAAELEANLSEFFDKLNNFMNNVKDI